MTEIVLKQFNKQDLMDIEVHDSQWELHYVDREVYGEYLEDFSYLGLTAHKDGKPLFIAVVIYSELAKDGKSGEGLFIMSKEYIENFRKYGIRTFKEVRDRINTLELDKILATCYNSNRRGAKLIQLLGFKEKDKTSDFMGRPMRLFEYNLKQE